MLKDIMSIPTIRRKFISLINADSEIDLTDISPCCLSTIIKLSHNEADGQNQSNFLTELNNIINELFNSISVPTGLGDKLFTQILKLLPRNLVGNLNQTRGFKSPLLVYSSNIDSSQQSIGIIEAIIDWNCIYKRWLRYGFRSYWKWSIKISLNIFIGIWDPTTFTIITPKGDKFLIKNQRCD